MIVSDKTVEKALIYLADDPHPLAVARFNMVKAENEAKRLYAELYLRTSGTVKERESTVEIDPVYVAAKDAEADAILEFERHRRREKSADVLIDMYRTEQATARSAERVR